MLHLHSGWGLIWLCTHVAASVLCFRDFSISLSSCLPLFFSSSSSSSASLSSSFSYCGGLVTLGLKCAGPKPGDNLNDRHTDILRRISSLPSQADLLNLGQVEALYLSIQRRYSFPSATLSKSVESWWPCPICPLDRLKWPNSDPGPLQRRKAHQLLIKKHIIKL